MHLPLACQIEEEIKVEVKKEEESKYAAWFFIIFLFTLSKDLTGIFYLCFLYLYLYLISASMYSFSTICFIIFMLNRKEHHQ
ncbi:MAG: hypothetical protein A2Y62_14185 [Candidatus Fischerbacteria bacterium RBG_13_37_8]|uniref:Uncharacterized protein n=1 Tax=Candidatus Fischerbacteria bacterium RBG_13_37_8 TaxID=1817863 RepID=A0A1F5VFQ2_9BACT|nr:MAG: hypothetical protein A2Y62_14185 [Candidatus Fischerbacteria bacterium RBG_13_37_8]